MDFAAWMQVYLADRWWTFDPRNNSPRYGRILVATGRDAADVPLTCSFGRHTLLEFIVWIEQIAERETSVTEATKVPLEAQVTQISEAWLA